MSKSRKQKTTAVVPTPQPVTESGWTPFYTTNDPLNLEPANPSDSLIVLDGATAPAADVAAHDVLASTAPIIAPVARGALRNAVAAPPAWALQSLNPFQRGAIRAAFELAKTGAKFSDLVALGLKPAFAAQNIGKGLRDWADASGPVVGHTGLIWDVLINGAVPTIDTRATRHPLSLTTMRDAHVRVVNIRRADGLPLE